MKPTKRKTVMSYVRAASDKMARAVNAAIKSPDISNRELQRMVDHLRRGAALEDALKKPKARR
jgi:hypothetical protein